MRKSKGISKYDIHWQIVRTSVKGKGEASLNESINEVYSYFNANKTQDRWERSVNWIEALIKGFTASGSLAAIDKCNNAILLFGSRENLTNESFEIESQMESIKQYSFEQRYHCWKDLFRYEKNFCSRNYRNKELETLTNQLWDVFTQNGELSKIKSNFSYDKILNFRENYKSGTNKQKFFF